MDATQQFIVTMVVTAVIGIATVVSPFIVYFLQRNRRDICFEIISDTSLEIKENILFNTIQITTLRVVLLRIWNAGNASITSEEFEKPISLEFGSLGQVIEMDIEEVNPEDLSPTFKKIPGGLVLTPLLLNKKDSIKLKVLLNGLNDKVKISARIKGVNKLSEMNTKKRYRVRLIMAFVILYLLLASGVWILNTLKVVQGPFVIVILVLITIALATIFYQLFSSTYI